MIYSGIRRLLIVLSGSLLLVLAACGGSGDAEDNTAQPAAEATTKTSSGNTAAGNASAVAERPVISETLPYAEVGEELVYGYFVFPADMVEPLPAVVVIHEWWGLTDGVRAMADRIAAQGYIVLAVDLFGGATATAPAGGRDLMVRVLENPEPANENLRQAYDFVSNTAGAPRVASLGWAFGGSWSLNMALLLPDRLDAAVIYYGQVTDDDERLAPLDVPLLGIFAENDRGIPVESVEEFKAALDRLRKDYQIRIFERVGHAFANPDAATYAPKSAAEAWDLTTAFLARHLGNGNAAAGN